MQLSFSCKTPWNIIHMSDSFQNFIPKNCFFVVLFRNLRKWRSKDSGGCLGEIKLKLCSRGETDKNFKKMGWKTLSHTHQVKKFLYLIHSSLTRTWTVNGPWLLLTKLGERETLFKISLCCHRQKIGITLSGVAKQTYKQNNKQKNLSDLKLFLMPQK